MKIISVSDYNSARHSFLLNHDAFPDDSLLGRIFSYPSVSGPHERLDMRLETNIVSSSDTTLVYQYRMLNDNSVSATPDGLMDDRYAWWDDGTDEQGRSIRNFIQEEATFLGRMSPEQPRDDGIAFDFCWPYPITSGLRFGESYDIRRRQYRFMIHPGIHFRIDDRLTRSLRKLETFPVGACHDAVISVMPYPEPQRWFAAMHVRSWLSEG